MVACAINRDMHPISIDQGFRPDKICMIENMFFQPYVGLGVSVAAFLIDYVSHYSSKCAA
jgi:hypothetical protein